MITLQLWYMDLEKKRITKHGNIKDFIFTVNQGRHRFGGDYINELRNASGVGDYELDIIYE